MMQIAEVDYERKTLQRYSSTLKEVVEKCLVADPTCRPDSVQVSQLAILVLHHHTQHMHVHEHLGLLLSLEVALGCEGNPMYPLLHH